MVYISFPNVGELMCTDVFGLQSKVFVHENGRLDGIAQVEP